MNYTSIPPKLLDDVCNRIGDHPYKYRGIIITRKLIRATMEILNAESNRTLPQNSRNAVRENTPDGLDKRIKESLNTNLRTGNIISDVLKEADIVEIIRVKNQKTGRIVKGTKLLQEWTW